MPGWDFDSMELKNSTSRGISLGLQNIPRVLHRQKFGLNFTWWLWIMCVGLSCSPSQPSTAGISRMWHLPKLWESLGLGRLLPHQIFHRLCFQPAWTWGRAKCTEKTPVRGVCGRAASPGDERERKMAQAGRKWLLPVLLVLWVLSRVSGAEAVAPAVTNVCDFVPGRSVSRANPVLQS